MTSQEFVTWFKGFVSAANTFNITPKQWDSICEQLEKVELPQRLSKYTLDTNSNNSNWTTTTAIADNKDNSKTKPQLND
jgi:hypothetical protein